MPTPPSAGDFSVLKKQIKWENLYFYQKSDVIYQMSFVFCDRFIHLYKDRTRDQVIQAARSCKQNIVEGLSDGVTSTEMQLKLLNIARASLQELKEDFEDYLKSRHLKFFGKGKEDNNIPVFYYDNDEAKYDQMLNFCRQHNLLSDYQPFFTLWTDQEMCNYGLTLCHMVDHMMISFMRKLEKEFIEEGGIKERMHKARTGYRAAQDERLLQLEAENPRLLKRIEEIQQQLDSCRQQLDSYIEANNQWKVAYDDLKSRASAAYIRQQEEIARLKALLEKNN